MFFKYAYRGALLKVLAFSICTAAGFAHGQEKWPTKPVTIISPYNPGGTNDIVARLLADRLQKKFGQTFIVENKPGAGGIIGTNFAIRAKPDGYTLLLGNNGALVIQSVVRNPSPYNPSRQLTPIVKVAEAAQFIAVSSDLPVKTVADLISLAKKEPAKLNYTSAGIGSFGHLLGENLKYQSGIDIVHIPAPGSAAGLNELMAHRVQVMVDPIVLSQATSNKIRILATLGKDRFEAFPNIPTIVEAGGPRIDITGWFGLFGPAGLSKDIVEKINSVSEDLARDPDMKKIFLNAGLVPSLRNDKVLADLVREDMRKVADLQRHQKISIE